MSLTFYSCADPPNKLNKTLTTLGSTSYFKPYQPNGETTVQYLLDGGMPEGTNYIYDSDLNRYFFVVEVVHDVAKTIIVNCVLDPLYSFRNKLGGTFYFVRGADEVNEMEDSNYPLSDYIITETYNFNGWDNNFFKNSNNGKRFILKTAVGKARESVHETVTLTANMMVHHQNCEYIVRDAGGQDSKGFYFEFTSYATQAPQGPSIDKNDICVWNGVEWLVTSVTKILDPATQQSYYTFEFRKYD